MIPIVAEKERHLVVFCKKNGQIYDLICVLLLLLAWSMNQFYTTLTDFSAKYLVICNVYTDVCCIKYLYHVCPPGRGLFSDGITTHSHAHKRIKPNGNWNKKRLLFVTRRSYQCVNSLFE